jgi:4'-phosphopantetheinyl transferase
VDIEGVRDDIDHAAIARRFFSGTEGEALLAQPERSRAAAFFAIWTRKEAYIKLLGGGLSTPSPASTSLSASRRGCCVAPRKPWRSSRWKPPSASRPRLRWRRPVL